MGRSKIVRTPEELEAKKRERNQKYWGEERNAERRARYQADKTYREVEKSRSRAHSRKKAEGFPDPRSNIKSLGLYGHMRDVQTPTGPMRTTCLTFEELAHAMGRNVYLLRRWRAQGRFPSGVLLFRDIESGRQITQAFNLQEAMIILRVIGKHFETNFYYQDKHTDTRDRLFKKLNEYRSAKDWVVDDDYYAYRKKHLTRQTADALSTEDA
jgi:hypothetical protein